jgi:hypothetical protein
MNDDEYLLLLKQIEWYLPEVSVNIYSSRKNILANNPFIVIVDVIPNNTLIVYTSWRQYFSISNMRNKFNSIIIDRHFILATDADYFRKLYYNTSSISYKESVLLLSKQNFTSLHDKKMTSTAYCILTGPSSSQYKEIYIDNNAYKIICNSIVKNKKMLQHIGGPDLIVFADPVFHFSINEYCIKFRKDLLEVYDKYKPFIGMPLSSVPIFLNHFPFMHEHIIGFNATESLSFPSVNNNMSVKSFGNIMTFLMIPVASSLAVDVKIFGADGRNINDKYFWSYNKTTQYTESMKSVYEMHPSFIDDYNIPEYYKQHIINVSNLLAYGEEQGIQYHSLTSSYIPALSEREINGSHKTSTGER